MVRPSSQTPPRLSESYAPPTAAVTGVRASPPAAPPVPAPPSSSPFAAGEVLVDRVMAAHDDPDEGAAAAAAVQRGLSQLQRRIADAGL